MNRSELIENILGLYDGDYKYGVAETSADYVTMEELIENELLNMNCSQEDGPTIKEFYGFLEKYQNRDIELKLLVIDPIREDFRIEVQGVSILSEYAKLRTQEDMLFWKDFMTLGKKGFAEMTESEEQVCWVW